jgi:hypothetical protein
LGKAPKSSGGLPPPQSHLALASPHCASNSTLIIGVILALLIYAIDAIPIFEPFRMVARTIVIVIGVLILSWCCSTLSA